MSDDEARDTRKRERAASVSPGPAVEPPAKRHDDAPTEGGPAAPPSRDVGLSRSARRAPMSLGRLEAAAESLDADWDAGSVAVPTDEAGPHVAARPRSPSTAPSAWGGEGEDESPAESSAQRSATDAAIEATSAAPRLPKHPKGRRFDESAEIERLAAVQEEVDAEELGVEAP